MEKHVNNFIDALALKFHAELRGDFTHNLRLLFGQWIASESEDANLSEVQVAGSEDTLRYIPKCTDYSFAAGDVVLMIKGGPMGCIIVGKVYGNPSVVPEITP